MFSYSPNSIIDTLIFIPENPDLLGETKESVRRQSPPYGQNGTILVCVHQTRPTLININIIMMIPTEIV